MSKGRWLLAPLGALVLVCLVLAGCTGTPPSLVASSPRPTELRATAVPIEVMAGTAPPVFTPTREPTATRAPTATPSSSPTPTLMPTATSSPSPTLSPSPTPLPSAQMEAAQRYQANGEYEQAIAAYQALLEGSPDPEQAREVRYHLAECYLLDRDYASAAGAWEEYISRYRDDERFPQASLMTARAYHAAGLCSLAIRHYDAYLSQERVLADQVGEWIGDCHAADQQLEAAIAAYRRALEQAGDRGTAANLREKIAGVYLAQGDYTAAVAEYDAILAVARIEEYRAKIEYLAAQALAAAGQSEAATLRYRRAVDSYPKAAYAYLSLVELVNAEVEVEPFQRGLVDYYAGTSYPDAYEAAIRAFDRYLETEPAARADEALYYKALAQRALDRTDEALATLEMIILNYPRSQMLGRAWFEKAATLAAAGDNSRAVKVYQDVAAFFPADALAPQALWKAAKLCEGEGAFGEAARLYEDLQASFPAYEDAEEALWRAGLSHYRAGARDKAALDWQALSVKYPSSSFRPRALFWLGKLEAESTAGKQRDYWDQLVQANPYSYYALRVGQLRAGQSPTAARLITAAVEPPSWDAQQVEGEILAWLRGWTAVPTETSLLDLPAALSGRSDLQRGLAFLRVGMRREALAAFDSVRSAAWKDALALARLALFFREQGLYGLAARCAHRLVGLWPKGYMEDAPHAVQRLAYPLVYADLLSAEAQAYNLDPLLLAALIRQESLFEPTAESYAGARGLGQVMPATGEGIAKSLGLEGFALDDLYRPWVSVRFAAFYLAAQMKRFDNQILVALAAYNGGPGNTLRWLEAGGDPSDMSAAGQDLDLFVEVITASQSQRYLQQVYEQYILYESLYRPLNPEN